MTDYSAIIALPFGRLGLLLDVDHLLHGLHFLAPDTPLQPAVTHAARSIEERLQAWCAGECHPLAIEYRLREGTPFQRRVWQAMLDIPCGETRTYGAIASQLGSSARAVGGACGRNPLPLLIPCHRIVAHHHIGGFNQGTDAWLLGIKHWLLAHELRLSGQQNGALFAPRHSG